MQCVGTKKLNIIGKSKNNQKFTILLLICMPCNGTFNQTNIPNWVSINISFGGLAMK